MEVTINSFRLVQKEKKNENKDFITSDGRVLGVTTTAVNLNEALQKAYRAVGEISFEGMQFRNDIGK